MLAHGAGRVMTDKEAEEFVLALLASEGPRTTMDIERAASSAGRQCPDKTVLFLTKMKRRGLIRGEVSQERRGWLWSLA